MAPRRHPSERAGPRPVPDDRVSTTALIRRLAAGEHEPEDELRRRLTPPLSQVVAALRDDPDDDQPAVGAAIGAGIEAVGSDPDGAASLHGGSWDGVGFGGFVLRHVLAAIGRPSRLDSPRLHGLSLQERVVLLLVEVELLAPAQVAALLCVTEDEVATHQQRLQTRLGLGAPPSSGCSAWPSVRTVHRLQEDELEEASVHLTVCEPCGEAADELDARRAQVVQSIPGIAWTQLGQAHAERRRDAR